MKVILIMNGCTYTFFEFSAPFQNILSECNIVSDYYQSVQPQITVQNSIANEIEIVEVLQNLFESKKCSLGDAQKCDIIVESVSYDDETDQLIWCLCAK